MPLPTASQFIDINVTERQFKEAQKQLLEYIATLAIDQDIKELLTDKVNNDTLEQGLSLKADKQFVEDILLAFQNGSSGIYLSLEEANADIANIGLKTKVTVLNEIDGGDYYKESVDSTQLKKSPYDILTKFKLFLGNLLLTDTSKQFTHKLVDQNGRFALLVKKDGSLITKYGNLTLIQKIIKDNLPLIQKLNTLNFDDLKKLTQIKNDNSKDLFRFVVGDRLPVRIKRNGHIVNNGKDLLNEIEKIKGSIPTNLTSLWISPNKNLVAVGDSLTAYSHEWFANLYKYLNDKDRTFTNHAVGGDTSVQQAAKYGASFFLLTLTNQKILSTQPTVISGTFIKNIDGTLNNTLMLSQQSSGNIRGTIQGILGKINVTYANGSIESILFTPDIYPETDVPVTDYTPFIPENLDIDKFKTLAIAIGRNNLSSPDRIKQDILDMIKSQATIEKRFFIITPPSTTYSNPDRDNSTILNNVKELERWAMANFGDRVIVSRQILMRHGNGSEIDNTDIANGYVPTSLCSDGLHWTENANVFISQAVANLINSKGW